MAPIPILDLYLLSMLDRGLSSLYDLRGQAGLSLGASTPALKRLTKLGLVTSSLDGSSGKRKKYQLELTSAGRRAARTQWRKLLDCPPPADLDSVLRIVDMALHHKAQLKIIVEFLTYAAGVREMRSGRIAFLARNTTEDVISKYPRLRSECNAATLKAEAKALREIVTRLTGGGKRPGPQLTYVGPLVPVPEP